MPSTTIFEKMLSDDFEGFNPHSYDMPPDSDGDYSPPNSDDDLSDDESVVYSCASTCPCRSLKRRSFMQSIHLGDKADERMLDYDCMYVSNLSDVFATLANVKPVPGRPPMLGTGIIQLSWHDFIVKCIVCTQCMICPGDVMKTTGRLPQFNCIIKRSEGVFFARVSIVVFDKKVEFLEIQYSYRSCTEPFAATRGIFDRYINDDGVLPNEVIDLIFDQIVDTSCLKMKSLFCNRFS